MDEMVRTVSERSGLSVDTVRTVLTTAVDYLKEKLPPQYAAQADMFLKGGRWDRRARVGRRRGRREPGLRRHGEGGCAMSKVVIRQCPV
jgi:hypothetical protein